MVEVSRYMSQPVHSIPHDATLQQAAEKMRQLKVGSLLVVRAGDPVGIITDTDMTRKVLARGIQPESQQVVSIMTSPLITIDVRSPLGEANQIMNQKQVRHLVVTESGRVVGILSARDLTRYFDELFKIPGEESFAQKRGYVRLPFSALVTYQDNKKRRFESITYDISAGGLFIQTKSPLPQGSPIDIELILPKDQKTIRSHGVITWLRKKAEEVVGFPVTKVKGEVAYVREKMQRKVAHPGMGVKFTDISKEDQIKIMDFITDWIEKLSPPSK